MTRNRISKEMIDKKFVGEVDGLSQQLADKVSYGEVDTKVSQIVSGSPKGTYTTLSELQTAYPSGTTGVYVVTADGNWYYWNGTAWTSGGVYQSTGVGSNSVEPEHVTFLNSMKRLKNFFDKSRITLGGYYHSDTGEWTVSTTADSSDEIPVEAGDIVELHSFVGGGYHVSYWDANHAFLSGTYIVLIAGQSKSVTVPENAKYLKTAVKTSETERFLITKNNEMEYSSVELKENVSIQKQLQNTNLAQYLDDNSITPDKTTYLETANVRRINHFDKTAIQSGGYYNNLGSYVTSSTVSSSHFIPVKSNDTIRVKVGVQGNNHITFWDNGGNYVTGEVRILYPNEVSVFTVPSNPAITSFKIAVRNNEIANYMITVNEAFPETYWSYDQMDFDIELKAKMSDAVKRETGANKTVLDGMKWGIVGDSISTVGYKGGEYPAKIGNKNNMPTQNLAVPGSLIAKSSKSGHGTTHMCKRVLELDTDCDIVTVAGGTNDQRFGVPIGTFSDTSIETFYGAMHELCKNMISRFPETPKAIFTPIKMRGVNDDLKRYVDVIKEVAAYYSIPVCDNFNEGDLQPDIDMINTTYFSNADGVHPNTRGHDILARKVEAFMKNLVG